MSAGIEKRAERDVAEEGTAKAEEERQDRGRESDSG